ncbi:MAG: 2-hydroxyacyl-CoA dehydratase subunit D [Candidatus Aquicultorales bacterium]
MHDISQELDDLRLSAADEGDAARIGWLCVHAPLELIAAAGLRPVRIRPRSSDPRDATDFLSSKTCSYLRCSFEECLGGVANYDGILASSCCEGERRTFELLKKVVPLTFAELYDVPKVDTIGARHFMLQRLANTKHKLEKAFDVIITNKSLAEAVRGLNMLRSALKELDHLRSGRPGILANGDFHELVLLAMEAPLDVATKVVASLNRRLRKTAGQRDGVRMGVAGNVVNRRGLFDALEDRGIVVVGDDLCAGSRFYAENSAPSGDILEGLANRYFQAAPCPMRGLSRKRQSAFIQELGRRGATGVILVAQRFCDATSSEFAALKIEAAHHSLSAIRIDLDESSPDDVSAESIGRIVEMVA